MALRYFMGDQQSERKRKIKHEIGVFHKVSLLCKSAGGAGLNGEGIAVIRLKIARTQRGKVQDKGPTFWARGKELANGSWKWCMEDSSQRAEGEKQELTCMPGTPAVFLFNLIAVFLFVLIKSLTPLFF